MTSKLHIESLKTYFNGRRALSSGDLAVFYRKSEPEIKETTVNWRIYELVRLGVLKRISRGHFQIGRMKLFTPEPTKRLSKIYRNISAQFPYIQLCIWETSWLNDLTQHLSNRSLTILEAEKDVCEAVFHRLQERNKGVFLAPSIEIMERYVSVENSAIIVKPMVSEAPLQKADNVNIPMLEKILVDLVCDTDLLYAYQGREIQHIWENAFSKYTVQQDKILRYASRRKKKRDIREYIHKAYNSTAI